MMKSACPLLFALAACGFPPPVTPSGAEASTYRLATSSMQATAWVVAPGYLMTAGHVCLHAAGAGETVYAVSSGRRAFPTSMVAFEMTPGPEADLCVLSARVPMTPALPLAQSEPAKGTPVAFVGYPDGDLTRGAGAFVASGEVTLTSCIPGASGAAVYGPDGVIGVLVQYDVTQPEACFLTPLAEIRSFLRFADVTPTLPGPGFSTNADGLTFAD